MRINILIIVTVVITFLLVLISCKIKAEEECTLRSIQVTATAYNSLAYQTNSNPSITAFGDSLKPGLKYVAVSRDLIDSGLVYNTKLKIEGFDSLYIVKDKMNSRWRKRIDIYMDEDVKKALEWGKRKVIIEFCVKTNDSI